MSGLSEQSTSSAPPPKLDLRGSGILKGARPVPAAGEAVPPPPAVVGRSIRDVGRKPRPSDAKPAAMFDGVASPAPEAHLKPRLDRERSGPSTARIAIAGPPEPAPDKAPAFRPFSRERMAEPAERPALGPRTSRIKIESPPSSAEPLVTARETTAPAKEKPPFTGLTPTVTPPAQTLDLEPAPAKVKMAPASDVAVKPYAKIADTMPPQAGVESAAEPKIKVKIAPTQLEIAAALEAKFGERPQEPEIAVAQEAEMEAQPAIEVVETPPAIEKVETLDWLGLKKTPEIKPPAPPASEAEGEKASVSDKKKTSRIPLELAMAKSAEGKEETTRADVAQIKPLAAPITIKFPKPKPPGMAPLGEIAAGDAATAAKRKTSRISLEAALAVEGASAPKIGETAPKTIKLKRPSEAGTVKAVQHPVPSGVSEQESPAEKPAMSKTAPLPADTSPEEEEEGPTPTRRKTIRVKRPTERTGIKDVDVKTEGAPAPEAAAETRQPVVFAAGPPPAADDDRPGWMFSLCAIAAIFVACVVIYVLTAQAYPDLNLTWPGTIQ